MKLCAESSCKWSSTSRSEGRCRCKSKPFRTSNCVPSTSMLTKSNFAAPASLLEKPALRILVGFVRADIYKEAVGALAEELPNQLALGRHICGFRTHVLRIRLAGVTAVFKEIAQTVPKHPGMVL